MYALSGRLLHLAFQGSTCAHKLCRITQHEAVEALCSDSTEGFSLRGKINMDFLDIFSEREKNLRFSQREVKS